MNHEQEYDPSVEESRQRHPSNWLLGDAPERPARESRERHAARTLCESAAHLHDFFRYGDPKSAGELELFLLESGLDVHAESLLDEVAGALLTIGAHRPEAWGAVNGRMP